MKMTKKQKESKCWGCGKVLDEWERCDKCEAICARCEQPRYSHIVVGEAYICPTSVFEEK